MTSERIARLERTMKLIFSGAIIKLSNLSEVERIFDTALQQVHDLEKSRDNWKKRAKEAEKKLKLKGLN